MLINDLLASGEIPGLFADDEVENIISGVRNEVKGAGLQDTRENCWMFFIERVRRNLKVSEILLLFTELCPGLHSYSSASLITFSKITCSTYYFFTAGRLCCVSLPWAQPCA